MDFKFVETCLNQKIDLLLVKSFCYGLTDQEIKILIDVDNGKYVIGFQNGEDAVAFSLKEQDKVLQEMIVDDGHRMQKDFFQSTPPHVVNTPNLVNTPSTINISSLPNVTYTDDSITLYSVDTSTAMTTIC